MRCRSGPRPPMPGEACTVSSSVITVEEHFARIVGTVRRLPSIGLNLLDAQGCVLAQDVTSEVPLPGFTNSAMDGYAVHAADLAAASKEAPVTLPVVHDIPAGNTQALSLAPGQSMRIMTGARLSAWVLPAGMSWTTGRV